MKNLTVGFWSVWQSASVVWGTFMRGIAIIVESLMLFFARRYSSIIQAYYLLYGVTLIQLHHSLPAESTTGISVINDHFGIHWSVAPTAFLLISLIVPTLKRHWSLALSLVPISIYSGVLAFGGLIGVFDQRGWLSVISNAGFFVAMLNVISLSYYLGKKAQSERELRVKIAELTTEMKLHAIRIKALGDLDDTNIRSAVE